MVHELGDAFRAIKGLYCDCTRRFFLCLQQGRTLEKLLVWRNFHVGCGENSKN